MFIDRIYDFTQKTIRKARTADPYELAEQLGITVKYKSFGDLKGTYFISKRQPFIILNDTLDEVMERVVIAHEIGHHLLHRHIAVGNFQEFGYFDMTSKPEKEANLFAANFLITDEDVISLAEEQYTSEQAACILKVPHQLILIKMEDMNKRGYNLNLFCVPRGDFLGR